MLPIRQNPSWNSPRQTDGVMLLVVVLGGITAMCLGLFYKQMALAAELAGGFVLVAALAFGMLRATAWARLVLTMSACGIVGSHVILAGGAPEAYMGMFVLGSVLTQYRSWRMVIASFAVLASIHLIWGRNMTGHPDTAIVLCALALQFTYNAYIAWCVDCSESERFELDFLIRATELANEGGHQVKLVVGTMQDISQSSRKITDIITVIDGIAFQTNILALHAAVEAAREIKSLIGASMQTIESGVSQVNLTGATMDDIVLAVRRVGEVFDQLSADSHERAGGIDVVTQSVKELDQVTQRNIAVAESSSGIAVELADHAQQMASVLSSFKLGAMHAVAKIEVPESPPVGAKALAVVASKLAPPRKAPGSVPAREPAGVEFF